MTTPKYDFNIPVGQSLMFPCEEGKDPQNLQCCLLVNAKRWGKKNGGKFKSSLNKETNVVTLTRVE